MDGFGLVQDLLKDYEGSGQMEEFLQEAVDLGVITEEEMWEFLDGQE